MEKMAFWESVDSDRYTDGNPRPLIKCDHQTTVDDLVRVLAQRNHPARWVVLGVLDSLRGHDPHDMINNDHVPSDHRDDYLKGNPFR